MNSFKTILKIVGILLLGALGALLFNVVLLPYMLSNSYFNRFEFIENFKQGTIIVNPKETTYIQENIAIEQAIERVKKSVVAIEKSGQVLSSGLVLTSDGNIITLASALPKGSFNVLIEGEPVKFKIAKIDFENNLALIEAEKSGLQSVGFAGNGNVKLGQQVFGVASSNNQPGWLAGEGIISEILPEKIRTNILGSGIVAGSPLFNTAGELVGLTFIDTGDKVSALPVDKIRKFLGL